MKLLYAIAMCLLLTGLASAQTKKKSKSKDSVSVAKPAPVERTPFRVRYQDVFKINDNGSVSPLYVVQIGGVTMSPGVSFTQGASFGGVDIASYKGHDLLIDTVNHMIVLKNIYQ